MLKRTGRQEDYGLEKLKLLAESIKLKLEAQQQMFLISPEEIARRNLEAKAKPQQIREEDYQVDIKQSQHKDVPEYSAARIASPASKRASVDMLEESFGVSLNLESVYRMMDKLDDKAIERLQQRQ